MIGLNKITDRIKNEAEQYAKGVIADAEAKAEDILTDAEEQAEKLKNEAVKNAKAEREKTLSRASSSSALTERNILLKAKTELLDDAFSAAEKKLLDLDTNAYRSFLERYLTQAVNDMNGDKLTVYPSVRDEKLVRDIVSGNGRIALGDSKEINGGFIVSDGDISITCTPASVLASMKSQLSDRVCKMLFED